MCVFDNVKKALPLFFMLFILVVLPFWLLPLRFDPALPSLKYALFSAQATTTKK